MYEYGDCDLLLLRSLIIKKTLYNFANITKLGGKLNKINLLRLVGKSHADMTGLMNQAV